MSRHRLFHAINSNYDDEWDDEDDGEEFGSSYSDHYSVSPSTAAQFTYRRDGSANQSFSDYLNKEDEERLEEADEEHLSDEPAEDPRLPCRSDEEEAKFLSCLDQIRDVIGDSISDSVLRKAVIDSQYDCEKALNTVLTSVEDKGSPTKGSSPKKGKPPAGVPTSTKSVAKQAIVFQLGDTQTGDEVDKKTASALSDSIARVSVSGKKLESGDKKDLKTPLNTPLKMLIEAETGRSSPSLPKSASKSKIVERLDAADEYQKRSATGKELINLIVAGHVDAGKSTLMGHLLYQLGVVSQRQMHRYETDSKKIGKASFMYAWVLDETEEERSRGVTMDIAQSRFETESKIVNLLDAPGHKDFIPNMITGAAQADCALLVVNATIGEFETGFELGGQTREHTVLIRSLGVTEVVVVINKMDTVGWSQTRYLEIANKLTIFMKQVGYKDSDVRFLPCSGLSGINLTKPPMDLPEFSWYKGRTLLLEIDNFKPPVRLIDKPLRMCVQDIFKGVGGSFSVAGRMEAGDIQNYDRVLVMPAGEIATIKGILIDDEPAKIGFAGDYITLQVTGIDVQKVYVGSVLCDVKSAIPVVTRFKARIVLFNIEMPITKGSPVVVHYQSLNEPAFVTKLISQLHKSTGEVLKRKPRCLTKNTTAMVEITLPRPQCLELYKDFKDLGRFMLRSEGHTIAAGMVTEICDTR